MGGPGGPITIGMGSTKQWRESFGKHRRGEDFRRRAAPTCNLDPAAFRPDQSVVISGTPVPYDGDPEGGSITKIGSRRRPGRTLQAGPGAAERLWRSLRAQPGRRARLHPARRRGPEPSRHRRRSAPGRRRAPKRPTPRSMRRPARGSSSTRRRRRSTSRPGIRTARRLGRRRNRDISRIGSWAPSSAMPALVPTLKEVWTAPDGTTRERETLGRVDFLSSADQRRWEEAGSPPPFAYDPDEHDVRPRRLRAPGQGVRIQGLQGPP